MTFLRPRSLGGLILLGLLLVTLPLIGGIVNASLEMTRLSDSTERLVVHGVRATRYSQALVRQVAAMERTARLYQLLARADLREVFDENHRRMNTVLDGFATLPGDTERRELVGAIRERAGRIAIGLGDPSTRERAAALGEFGPLSQETGRLSLLAARQIDQELRTVQDETQHVRRRLLWQTAALLPITLIIALAFALRLARPIREIDTAIANLGHGRLEVPVSIKGPPTDLEALGRQIEWLRQRLREVSEERERFLRHVSHELKTPLANLREAAELLSEGAVGPLSAEQSEISAIMRENSLRLQQLIENLLSYSEWQTKGGGLDVTEFPLAPLVRSVAESYQLPMSSRKLRLTLDLPDIQVTADRAKLRLIIDNLLSNAVKFTPDSGTITVRARIEDGDLALDVTDSGPGVPAEERERIFEPFFQGATPRGGLVRGTGIGLSVVKEFVHAHDGSVELVGDADTGAHFRVRLPQGNLSARPRGRTTTMEQTMRAVTSVLFSATMLLAGCTVPQPQDVAAPAAMPNVAPCRTDLAAYIDLLFAMAPGDPARQQARLEATREAAAQAPTSANRLRFAIALGIAGHPASNPVEAKRLISELLAGSNDLATDETALAQAYLLEFDARAGLYAELARQQEEARRQLELVDESGEQRAEALAAENARLRRELAQAERMLEAVAEMERKLLEQAAEPVEVPPQP